MRKIIYFFLGKPKYYYDPKMGDGFRKGEYLITIYRYWLGKQRPVVAYADKNPLKVITQVRFYVDYVNNKIK